MSELGALVAAQTDLPLTRVSQLLGAGRTTLYRLRRAQPVREAEMELRDRIQRIALEMPAYGYRRITATLQREGQQINHRRVLRLMRADNLLCLRTRPFVRTTDSDHGFPVYPNLVPLLQVTDLNQLWVTDITYVRLARGIHLPRRRAGRVQSPLHWLATEPSSRCGVGAGRPAHDARRAPGGARGWCITPIEGCSTPRTGTLTCSPRRASRPA